MKKQDYWFIFIIALAILLKLMQISFNWNEKTQIEEEIPCISKVEICKENDLNSYIDYFGVQIPVGYLSYVSHHTGIPLHRIAATWAYETANGTSWLWREHLNPSGIAWTRHAPGRIRAYDERWTNKASYSDLKSSADDWIRVLSLKRYKKAREAKTDYEFFAYLYRAGYFSHKSSIKRRASFAKDYKFLEEHRQVAFVIEY